MLAAQAFVVLVGQGRIEAPIAGRVAVYVANLFDATYTIAFLAVIFMIAPTGRLLSRRWRYAVAVPIAAVVVNAAVILTLPAENLQPGRPAEAGAVALALLIGSGVALLVSVVLGAVALWVRLRRSTGDERRQLRWIATSAAVLAGTFVLLGVGNLVLGFESWVVLEALYLAYIGVFVSVGIAILRYRLYDIDVILSRAIVLAVLAVFVTVGYVGVVVAIGSVLAAAGTAVSGVFWPSLVATALVAAAFQPVRRHVLHLADRLVYGEQAAPYEALADLSRRLADSPSPEQLPARVAESAGRAVGAAHTRVRLGTPDNDPSAGLIADWPTDPPAGDLPTGDTGADPGSPTVQLPVVDRGERVGSIAVIMPRGRDLRAAERRLLADFAEQAGVAFRNTLLQTELTARVDEIAARSRDLEQSRRRLVDAEDTERERLAAAIRRRVVTHLAPVIQGIGGGLDITAPDVAGELDRLISHTQTAVDELRAVSHGVFPALLHRRGLRRRAVRRARHHPPADRPRGRRLRRPAPGPGRRGSRVPVLQRRRTHRHPGPRAPAHRRRPPGRHHHPRPPDTSSRSRNSPGMAARRRPRRSPGRCHPDRHHTTRADQHPSSHPATRTHPAARPVPPPVTDPKMKVTTAPVSGAQGRAGQLTGPRGNRCRVE